MPGELSKILEHVETDERARPRRGRADLARRRAPERPARRRAAPQPAARASPPGRAGRCRGRLPGAQAPADRERSARPHRRAAGRAGARGGGVRRGGVRLLARSRGTRTTWARSCGWPTRRPPIPATLPPVAVKDLFCVEGVPSSAGSRILEGYLPVYTATSVRNLQAAGASVLGKTNQDEFAMGSSNENSGFGPTRTHGIAAACREARAEEAPPPWPPAWRRGRSAPTPAARSASPPRYAASSGSSRPTARSAATG